MVDQNARVLRHLRVDVAKKMLDKTAGGHVYCIAVFVSFVPTLSTLSLCVSDTQEVQQAVARLGIGSQSQPWANTCVAFHC